MPDPVEHDNIPALGPGRFFIRKRPFSREENIF